MTVLMSGLSGQLGHGIVDTATMPMLAVARRSAGERRLRRRLQSRSLGVEVVYGDVSANQWGLDADTVALLADRVTCVVNCAGNTDWSASSQELHLGNVTSAVNGVRLTKELANLSGRAIPYVHTSTVYVAGSAIGHVPEALLPAGADRTRYEHFKWLGEQTVVHEAARLDVPVLVARFPALLGDSVTGETLYKNSLYLLAERWNDIPLGLLPAMRNARVDCISRDTAARILLQIVDAVRSDVAWGTSRVVHISNGSQAPTLRALIETARMVDANAFDTWPHVVPATREQVTGAAAIADRFGRLGDRWHNALIGLRYIALDRTFERTNLTTLITGPAPSISLEDAARMTFGLTPTVEPVANARHRALARFVS